MSKIAKVDLAQINRELVRIDDFERRLSMAESNAKALQVRTQLLEEHAPVTSNNLSFTWTGGTTTLSWAAGSIQDKKGNNIPVLAGALVVNASTYYWLAWNKIHQQMVAKTTIEELLQNKNNLVICQIFTGTGAQTGTAGGGGSNSHSELSGTKYKNF